MKKRWNATLKKACALLLVLVMVLGYIPGNVLTVRAEDAAHNNLAVKVADPATVNAWKTHFPANSTEYAGGVWTDKSVFEDAADYLAATDEADNAHAATLALSDSDNFLVSLSAIASTKSIKGYASIPTDTIFVLDMSSSMYRAGAIDDLANAADDAIEKLLNENKNNRVGVVFYSGSGYTDVLMPLDRYSTTVTSANSNKYLRYNNNRIYVVNGVTGEENTGVAGDYGTYHSGTFTQDGIYVAMKQLEEAEKTVESGLQAGVERMPIIVLMTDGAPTIRANEFTGNMVQNNMLTASLAGAFTPTASSPGPSTMLNPER